MREKLRIMEIFIHNDGFCYFCAIWGLFCCSSVKISCKKNLENNRNRNLKCTWSNFKIIVVSI